MWRKILRWLLVPVLDEVQPALAKLIDDDKVNIIKTLQEADGSTLAKQLCEKIKEAIQ